MTKTFVKGALFAAAATLVAATPASAAPEPFQAKANIVKPLTIQKVTDLNFGTITMEPALTSANVVVSAASGATAVCDTNLTCDTASTSGPASFTIGGVGSQVVSLNYGTVPTVLKSGTNTVAFTKDGQSSITLSAGAATLYVGGTITVTDSTKPGAYSADLEVSASYQ